MSDDQWREAIKQAESLADIELVFRQLWPSCFPKPFRKPLFDFPDVVIHATETAVKKHPCYKDAKAGDEDSSATLVEDTLNMEAVDSLRVFLRNRRPILISAHAMEGEGVNAIPEAFAEMLSAELHLQVESGIVQINTVGHTGANGFARLARQPIFEGDVTEGQDYLMVDDFVGMGGTLANLKGYLEHKGGVVIGATVLTGKPYSAKIALERSMLYELREKHGNELESWWQKRFGHTFDCLTQSEARYLFKTPDADTIRNRIIASEQEGNRGGSTKEN